MTSNRSDLTARLQRRLENERAEIEVTAVRELKVLGESLRGVAKNALRTIEADTAAATGRMRGILLRAWLRPLVIGLSLSVGISGGSWAAMRLLWTAIEWKVETLPALTADIEQARQTLTEIEETTWELELREVDGARCVVLPAGTPDPRERAQSFLTPEPSTVFDSVKVMLARDRDQPRRPEYVLRLRRRGGRIRLPEPLRLRGGDPRRRDEAAALRAAVAGTAHRPGLHRRRVPGADRWPERSGSGATLEDRGPHGGAVEDAGTGRADLRRHREALRGEGGSQRLRRAGGHLRP